MNPDNFLVACYDIILGNRAGIFTKDKGDVNNTENISKKKGKLQEAKKLVIR